MKKILAIIMLAAMQAITVSAQNANAPIFRKDVKGKDVYFPLQEKGKTYKISGKDLAAKMGGNSSGDACACVDSFTQGYKVEDNVNIKVVDSFKLTLNDLGTDLAVKKVLNTYSDLESRLNITLDHSNILTANPYQVDINGTLKTYNINVNNSIKFEDEDNSNTISKSGLFLTSNNDYLNTSNIFQLNTQGLLIKEYNEDGDITTTIDAKGIFTDVVEAKSYTTNVYNTVNLPLYNWAVQVDNVSNKVYLVVNNNGFLHRIEIPAEMVD